VSARDGPACPRCDAGLRGPSIWASGWHCHVHGEVSPLWPTLSPSRAGLSGLLRGAAVPVWLPWPLPDGWLVTGFAGAGDAPTGTKGCAVALSGPSPAGGLAELLVVSEDTRVGLGCRFAGLDGLDPGAQLTAVPPAAAVRLGGHELPLWRVDAPGRAAFAGEVMGTWLWLVLWPRTAGALLAKPLRVRDLRDPGQELDLPFGAPSPQLPR
jgi:hypothetical protein